MQVVSVGFGKETFSANSVSLAAFHVTEGFLREVVGRAFTRQGHLQKFPASAYPEVNGYLFLDTVKVPDGQVLLLQCSHRQNARPVRDGAMFLRTRSTGPMLSIKAQLPVAGEATQTGDFLVFQGRADILDPDDLKGYGIDLPKNYQQSFLDPEEVAECYDVTVVAEETARKPIYEKAEDTDGNEVLLQKRPGRRLRIRSH